MIELTIKALHTTSFFRFNEHFQLFHEIISIPSRDMKHLFPASNIDIRPLIFQLSPKKTVEGFVGGGLVTLALGTLISLQMVTPYLACPVEVTGHWSPLFSVDVGCQMHPVFVEKDIEVSLETDNALIMHDYWKNAVSAVQSSRSVRN